MNTPHCPAAHGEMRPVYGTSEKKNKKGELIGDYSFWGCSHKYEDGKYCKQTIPNAGEYEYDPDVLSGKKTEGDPQEESHEFVRDLEAEKKHEAQIQLDEVAKKDSAPVVDKPMTRKDWTIKDIIIGLGVFSSPARKEGMDPISAFRDMHIWEWMDVAYGTDPVYEEWKDKAKERIK